MMVSDEEKRWLVVGIAMNKVVAPVLRDFIKQGMDTYCTNLDIYCSSLATPCTLKTLTFHQVSSDPCFKHLKFQNVNNNLQLHGKHKSLYNYNINTSVDLAKLFVPDYLAEFSGFDESLDISTILRLLGVNKPVPIFHSPKPLMSIQNSADDVRENVRNKWGHCNVTDWTEVFFNDSFSKLETLVRSLGLTGSIEKTCLDLLSDWLTKGCQLCMGHAVDQNLLSLVQQDVKELIKNYEKSEAEQSAIHELLDQQRTEQAQIQNTVNSIQGEQSSTRFQLQKHNELLDAMLEWKEQQMKEKQEIVKKLESLEKTLSEELLIRVEGLEKGLSEADDKVEQLERRIANSDDKIYQVEQELEQGLGKAEKTFTELEEGFARIDDSVEQLKRGFAKTNDKVEQLEQGFDKTDDKLKQLEEVSVETNNKVKQLEEGSSKTDDKVEQLQQEFAKVENDVFETGIKFKKLEEEFSGQRMKENKPASPVETFDVKFCRSKLAEHYKRTATVPTSVWSKTSPVDIHQIYTRLSLVKKQQTLAGSSQSQLHHYTHVFSANKDGVVPKRILVQGQTGIGKSTFVKKLAVDWAELDEEETGDKNKDLLKKLELVLVVNLKETSKCQSFRDVLRCCNIFPDEETALVEGLLSYITKNQENVLLVFDGYDEYRCGRNSDIYEIFRGKKLRNCHVLITTRISKANDLLEFKDKHAEITGFSKKDREAFMLRMLGDKAEVGKLKGHLSQEKLTDLTRVPLLLLFFCILWKNGRVKSFSETKAKLYLAIVQYVLDYSQGKSTSSRFGKVQDFNEILCEIGKVALECLLKDDHVFEYDQLSAAIFSDENRLIGLLQVTEYAENLRPAGVVSFIHKSVQEFLAAWYITYRCVPEGNLGEIEQRARTLEDCKALENVLQFICGLSDAGAVNVFQHLASVRISDSELKLLRALPTEDDETEVPLRNGTDRQRMFSNLVFELFGEVGPKDELLSNCFDCLGGVVLVPSDTRSLSRILPKMKGVSKQARSVAFVFPEAVPRVYKSLEFLNCLHVPLRLSESSKLCSVGNFLRSFMASRCFRSVLCFHNGQFQFYITGLELYCDHAALFTEINANDVSSAAVHLTSAQSCLEFLTSLRVHSVLHQSPLKATVLGSLLRNCKYLKRIEVEKSDDSVSELLEHVVDPSKCFLKICSYIVRTNSWLPRFKSIVILDLDLRDCHPDSVDTVVSCVRHKTLEKLTLSGISLSPEAAAALGRSLPEMSSLEALELTGKNEVLKAKEIESIFSGFNKAFPSVCKLSFHDFIMTSCLPSLTTSFRFFPNLTELNVGCLIMDERNTCALLDSLKLIPNVERITLSNPPDCGWRRPENAVISFTQMNCKEVELEGINLTPAVAAALGRSLPKMSSLETLMLSGVNGNSVQAEDMEALFGGFNKALPLYRLSFTGFCVRGCLAPLIKSLPFFPNLTELFLGKFSMDAYDLCDLVESLRFIPNLRELALQGTPLCHTPCCSVKVKTVSGFTHMNLQELKLNGISLIPAAAAALGRSLPGMSSLETLVLTGMDGSTVRAEEMEALFGGLTKTLPMRELTFSRFNVRGCLAPLFKSFRFFSNLRQLCLEELNMDEQDQCGLLESFGFIASNLPELRLQCKSVDTDCHSTYVNAVVTGNYKRLKKLEVNGIILNAAAAVALGQSLSKMSSLQTLEFIGENGNILQAEEMEALFSGFNKALPLNYLTFREFSVSCCLAPLIKRLRLFCNLTTLILPQFSIGEHELCSLMDSLRFIPELRSLSLQGPSLGSANCCTLEGTTFAPFSHTNLKELILHKVSLTPASAAAIGRLLPEMSSLETLVLTGMNGSTVQTEELEALFGGLNKTLPLRELTFSGFNVRGCLAPLFKSFRFFSNLRQLCLEELNMDEQDQCGVLESFGFIASNLPELRLQCKSVDTDCHSTVVNAVGTGNYRRLKKLKVNGIILTAAAAVALGQSLSKMSSLQTLEFIGENGNILQAEEMEALFSGFNKALPLNYLTFREFSMRGCLAPLIKRLRLFCNLTTLILPQFSIGEHELCSLMDSLRFFPKLRSLSLQGPSLGSANCCTLEGTTFAPFSHTNLKELILHKVSLTPASAAAIGRLLPEMSSIETLVLTGMNGSTVQTEELEALFGGLNKTLPLRDLTFSGFNVRGCLAPLTKSFRFFPNVREIKLDELNMDEQDQCGLLENFGFFAKDISDLKLQGSPLDDGNQTDWCGSKISCTRRFYNYFRLDLYGISLTPSVVVALGQLLPEMSSLKRLEVTGANGSILQTEEMEALFGGLNKTLPLNWLIISGFSARGCLAPLSRSLRFFPGLTVLHLDEFNMDDQDIRAFLESLTFIRDHSVIRLSGKPLSAGVRFNFRHDQRLGTTVCFYPSQCLEQDVNYVKGVFKQVLAQVNFGFF